jgi:hypothetical protein
MENAMLRLKHPTLGAFLSAALLLTVIGSTPALADARTSAEFALATCRGALDDLGTVDALARANNWAAAPEGALGPESPVVKLRSTWAVTQGEDKFLVATGTGVIAGTSGESNLCLVMFPDRKPQRKAFFDVMSAGLALKPALDATFPTGHMEIYEIKGGGPRKLILQLISSADGNVMMASMASLDVPAGALQPRAAAVDGSVRAFHAFDADTVYVLGRDGNLWREFGAWNNALQPRERVDGNVQAFQPLDGRLVYVLGSDGKLWREFGAWNNPRRPRQNVDGHVRAFQALDGEIVYVLGSDGKLWREFGAWDNFEQPRQQVDAQVHAFQALDAGTVYVLGNDGNLWREFDGWDNPDQPRVQVDASVRAFQALDAATVYVLGSDGNLWREVGSFDNAEQPRVWVDGNVNAFQALNTRTVFVLGSDGKLWREQGTMHTRSQVAANVLAFQAIDDDTVYVLCPGNILFRMHVPKERSVAQ